MLEYIFTVNEMILVQMCDKLSQRKTLITKDLRQNSSDDLEIQDQLNQFSILI